MKNLVGLCRALLLFLCVPAFSQVDTTYIYNASMPYGTLDIRIAKSATRYYYLQEDVTFSFRESAPGVKTNTYRDMTSWNSAPFREGNLREKNGNNDYFIMNYRFLLPNNYNPNFQPGYPVIIMFHGLGERGNCWDDNCYWGTGSWNPNTNNPPAPTAAAHNLLNNDHNLLHGGSKHLGAVNLAGSKLPDDPTLSPNAFPGIVIFPQNLNGWSNASVQDAIRLLRLMIKKYNVDENRVYIHGLSNGGGAVFQAIKRAPWLFAAALGMSAINDGGIVNDGMAPEVAKIPMWVFQGGQDLNPTPSRTYRMIRRFEEAGASVRYSFYAHLGHGTWNTAYNEKDFFSWILSHRKNNPHIYYGNPVICNTTGAGVKLSYSAGFPAYQWERDGVVISGANASQYIADTPGSYRGRFSRVTNPGENDWEPWSKAVVVTEISPAKPVVNAIGSTHLRGPGLPGNTANNSVTLQAAEQAELYTWYKDGQVMNFSFTDVNDTLRSITLTSSNTSANGAYTMVASYSYCPSPPSDPVQLFFNNSAPQNMTFDATAANFKGTVMPSGIFLSWKDVVSNETGYEIWRRKSGTTDFKFAGRAPKDAISFYDGPLEPSTTYQYKIRAISSTGASNYVPSNDLNVNYEITTGGDQTAPLAPQDLVMTTNTLSSISLSWKPAEDNTVIKEYIISYGANSVSTGGPQTTFTINGLPPNTTYAVSVKAVDFAGHVSAPSNQIMASTYVLGLYYKHSTGAWTDLDDPSLISTWNKPEFTGKVNNFTLAPRTQEDFFNFQFTGYFDIPVSGNYVFRLSSDDGSRMLLDNAMIIDNDGPHGNIARFSDTLFLNAGPHPLEVQYFDYTGTQTLSVQYKGPDISGSFVAIPDSLLRSGRYVAPTPPSAPANLQAVTAGMKQINLAWTYTTAGEAEIYRSLTSNGVFAIVGRTNATSFSDTTLAPNTTYYYKLKAVNGSGSSGFTAAVSAKTSTDVTPPSVPASLALSNQSHTNVAVTWQPSTDDVAVNGYEIFVDGALSGTSTVPSFTVTSLSPTQTYNITVRAYDQSGNKSGFSSALQVTTNASAVFYSLASGNLNQLSTWKQNANGTGSSPTSFAENAQYFIITNRAATGLGGEWIVSGNASKVIVSNGVTLNVDHAFSGSVELEGNAVMNLNHSSVPDILKLSPASTVNFAVASEVPNKAYGNLTLSGTGIKTFATETTTIAGNLVVGSGLTVKGSPANASSIVIGGNLIVNGAGGAPGADNRIHFYFTGATTHTITTSSDLYFYRLATAASSSVTISSGSTINIFTGSLNGGGLSLGNGSMLNVGANTLHVSGAGTVNSQNETGRLAIAGGKLKLSSSNSANANLYFDATQNSADSLIIDLSGALIVREPLKISGAVKIKSGTLNANGQLTLLSTASKSASIAQIESGQITGAVHAEQYIEPLGNALRDLSTPVEGVTIADWQNFFPVTGPFPGASGGITDPSIFVSNGTALIPYPGAGGTNQSAIQRARGYATRINSATPINLSVSGVPYQGNINYMLTPGSGGGADNGWNLVGNPYASPVVWNNNSEAWIRSFISNTIAVRENKVINGQAVSQYRYYNPLLGDAVIKAGQAFWVQSVGAGGALTITEKAKGGTALSYPAADPGVKYLSVGLQQGGITDETYIVFTADGTDAFDNQTDGRKKSNEGIFNISTIIGDNVEAAINFLPDSFCSKQVRLSITGVPAGSYALTFSSLNAVGGIGTISLKDNFTGTTTPVTTSPYNFAVTADPNSFGANRFVLTFTRTTLDVDTPQLQDQAVCDTDDATVELLQSQSGVTYVLLNSEDEVISSETEGNGAAISFTLDKTKLDSGLNHVRVRAGFKGCETTMLSTEADLNFMPSFTIEAPGDVSVCAGESAMLQVSGSPSGQYRWFDSNQVLIDSVTDATFTTSAVIGEVVYYVAGLVNNNCESEMKTIHVYGDTLEIPVIAMFNDTLFVQVDAAYQWKMDGENIIGATSPYYVPDATGDYSVMVFKNGCAKESAPFTHVIDPGCTVDTATPVVWTDNICGEESVTLRITNSQTGVMYTAINSNDDVISASVMGTGGNIDIQLSTVSLDSGENQIRIKADLEGCINRVLKSRATVYNVPSFEIVTDENVIVCSGEPAILTVSGAPSGGSYKWTNEGGAVIGSSGDQLTTDPVVSETVFFVSALHSSGCESVKKRIVVQPIDLQPVVVNENNILTTHAEGTYQWKFNGEPIAEATSAQYTPVNAGSYSVIVTNGNCTKESAAVAYFITAVGGGVVSEFALNTYPVPATAHALNIKVQSPKREKVLIQIIDITGRTVFIHDYTFDEIQEGVPVRPDNGALADGVYNVIAIQGKTEARKRIVIENKK